MTQTAEPPLRAAIIPVTPLQQNCTLIWCTKTMRGAFTDPGGDLPRLRDALAKTGVTLEKILITHGHIDHCGEAGILAREYGVPIEGPHEDDRFWISRLDEDGRKYGVNGQVFEPDRWLVNGDQVTVGDLVLDVIHCPGHTPGHVVFHHGTDFPMGNHADLINAITTRLWPLGGETVFVPGHGPTSSFAHERKTNAFVSDYALS